MPTDYVFATVASVFAWLAGQAVRRWRRQSSQLADAERGREAQTRLAVAQERVNIARELHDVIAHSMSVMVQRGSANLTGFGVERNLECGVLIRGGELPRSLAEHVVRAYRSTSSGP